MLWDHSQKVHHPSVLHTLKSNELEVPCKQYFYNNLFIMQTETAYPQWHMSFLALKISIKDKWSVMSLNLSFITTGSKTQLQIDCLTNNLLVLHTNVRIPVFVTLIFMIFVSIWLIYIYVYFTRKLPYVKERNKQLIHRLKHTKTTSLTSRLSFGVLSLVMVPKMDGWKTREKKIYNINQLSLLTSHTNHISKSPISRKIDPLSDLRKPISFHVCR